LELGDSCIVFDNFTASIEELMVANWVYWRSDKTDVYCHIIDTM